MILSRFALFTRASTAPSAVVALTVAVGLALILGLQTPPDPPAFAEGTFRACVLSHDMPLSTEQPDAYSGRTGLYLDLAQTMADREGATLQKHFAVTAFYKRPVREGLLAKKCDAYFGLPRTEGPWFIRNKVALTKSFTSIGYALALPHGESVSKLEDLKGKTVAVQGGSPGALAVSYIDGINTLTFRFATPALEALEAGEVDAALVWGPKAGYYVTHVSPDAFAVRATTLQWPVAIGVRADDRDALVPRLDALIDATEARVAELRATYGLPDGTPIPIQLRGPQFEDHDDEDERRESSVEGVGKASGSELVETTLLTHVPYADSADGDPEKGQRYFNSTYGCAHCHGTNAMGATSGTNLRTLEQRYGDEAQDVFLSTVRDGREGTAMPPWKGVISDEKIEDIQAFIFSIQDPAE